MGEKHLRSLLSFCLTLSFLIFPAVKSNATHVFGIDLYYEQVVEHTYRVYVVIYGDCSGAAFASLQNATPQVRIYEDPNTTPLATLSLAQEPPIPGIEVTPVCPSQINNTTCTNINNPIPGIKKFVYSATYTLPYTSANWRFHFTGSMGVATQAGRSSTITNIVNPGNTIIALDAKLNNILSANNSSVFGTIPTPFYCLNAPANYAPGSVDPENDSLYFVQVPGKDAQGFPPVPPNVTYIAPYTATAPLAANPFVFTPTTGQMSFTPNLVQRSLAVMEVREYRNNVMVGTSQREMTVVVLNTCNNFPPSGVISNPSAGTLLDSVTLKVCKDVGPFNFNINPTDPNGDTITVTPIGIPAGATFTIVNNTTVAPTCTFSWNTTNVPLGTYTFYLNYDDRQCPLNAHQQIAYQVIITQSANITVTQVSPATCTKKAVFTVNPGVGVTNWTETVLQGVNTIHTNTGLNGTLTDSLVAGTYTIRVTNSEGCSKDTVVTFTPPVTPNFASVTLNPPTCPGGTDGSISFTGSGGTPPYTYAKNTDPYGNVNTFTGLAAGSYTLHIKDNIGCIRDTVVNLPDGLPILLNIQTKRPMCNTAPNGIVTLAAYNNPATPYTYAMNAGPFGPGGTFSPLAAGTYTFHVQNATGCSVDTVITLTDSIIVTADIMLSHLSCYGDATGIIMATGAGGVTPYTYALNVNPYTLNNTFNSLPAGTYAVHVRDANSCAYDTSVTLLQPTPIKDSATVSHPVCYGTAGGSITIFSKGGTPTYTYANGAGPYGPDSTFSGLVAGTYTIHVQDAAGCIKDTIITITQPTPVTVSPAVTNVLCSGNATGVITITASGGTPGYTYANDPAPYGPSNSFTGLTAGTYTIHTKDANGCIKDTVITITQIPSVTVAAAVVTPVCYGDVTGSIAITAGGGTPTYTYANGNNPYGPGNTFSPLAAGTYTIHTRDANNCQKDTTITITQPSPLVVAPTVSNVLCNGGTGSITVVASGSTPGYVYANGNNPYGTGNIFTPLVAGTYTIHVRDTNNCQKDTIVNLTQPTPLALTAPVNNVLCFGGTGSVTIHTTGGTATYTYANGNNPYGPDSTFSLAAGTYTLHTQDANGCIKDTIITITQPPLLTVSASSTNVLCNGDATGTITATGAGGTPGYTYANGAAPYGPSNTFTGLTAGTYTIHTKDANSCIKDTIITITQPPVIVPTPTVTNVLCNGGTGSISIAATGGVPAYTYANGNNPYSPTNTFPSLVAGTYTIHTKDANGCIKDAIVVITQPTPLVAAPTVSNVLCNGGTGSITINASGGTGPYTYANGLANYSNSNTFTALTAGTYTIHTKDVNNCIKDTIVTITQPTPLAVGGTATNVLCNGDNNGTITINGTGGTPGYTYANGANPYGPGNTFSPLAPGTYTIHTKDANNCIKDTTITITQPTPVSVVPSVKNATCATLGNGIVTLNVTGGIPGYTYANGNNPYGPGNTFSPLAAGTYVLHVKDANGCIKNVTVTITDSLHPSGIIAVTDELCHGASTGVINVTGTGATAPYTYAIGNSPYVNTNSFTQLPAGTYILHIKDANGCIKDTNATIVEPTPIVSTITTTEPTCYGYNDGSLTATASGGTPAYTYGINNQPLSANNVFTNLPAGTNTIHITDNNGCLYDTLVTITQPTKLIIDSLVLVNEKCFGDNNGSVTVYANGGTPAYQYAIDANPFQSSTGFGSLYVGTYAIHVMDSHNCITDTTAEIKQPLPLWLDGAGITKPTCEGYADGNVALNATGGTPPYMYSVDGSNYAGNQNFPGLPEGTYTFYVQDSNQCKHDTMLTLTGYPHILIEEATVTPVLCNGGADGTIIVNATGGTKPYRYQVDGSPTDPISTNLFENISAGVHTVTVTDSNNCQKSGTTNVIEPDPIVIKLALVPNECIGTADRGMISAEVSGGTAPYTYAWSNDTSGIDLKAITHLANGSYRLTVSDSNNCKNSADTAMTSGECCVPYLPNAFTPNNDGKNDLFRAVFKGNMKLIRLSVYNRFGEQVYTTTVLGDGWDGIYKGQLADMGTYFFDIKFICGEGEKEQYIKGDVTLIR